MPGPYSMLTRGLNLMGWTASVNMQPGDALDCRDLILRHDGSFAKHHGWRRTYHTAITGRPLAIKGFAYKGKNVNDVRNGNFGIANDAGAGMWTRRVAMYTGCLLLTETNAYRWEPATADWQNVPLGGIANIDPNPKPTIQIFNNNLYIVGWADQNLRYDPVDETFYVWGWEIPATTTVGMQAGGALVPNAWYRYGCSWIDLMTGEESEVTEATNSPIQIVGGQTVRVTHTSYGATGGGARHWIGAAAANEDVGLVIYRSDADGGDLYFLDMVQPDLDAPGFFDDNGIAVDFSLKADMRNLQDPPLLNHFTEWRTMWFGASWDNNVTRVYYNDFRAENSFIERNDIRDYRELSLADGELITAIAKTNTVLIAFTNLDAYALNVVPSQTTGDVNIVTQPTEWGVGCVGPKAWTYVNGWLYFLSDRGPYRWQYGMAAPQFIGKNLIPMFTDPNSGLCQLSEQLRLESEVVYDQDTRTVRFIFPCGNTLVLNRHIGYWIDTERYNQDAECGWVRYSTEPQCMDLTFAIWPLVGGAPVDPFTRRPRLVFADNDGYVNEYDLALTRGALPTGVPATGTCLAGSGLNLIVTVGGLYLTGDDMHDMRLEVIHTDGTIDIRRVNVNTATNITPDAPFSQDPTGGTWYVGGIPSYWRSWVDSWGDPKSHKKLMQLYLGYNRTAAGTDPVLDISVAASYEWPLIVARARQSQLDQYRDRLLCSLVGRYFTYEIANTFPDQTFLVTYLETEGAVLPRKRKP